MSIGLAIMRLQPLHLGHQKIIDTMLAENEKAILMIGSVGTFDEKNPYSYERRLNMVKALYQKEIDSGKLYVGGLKDIHNLPKWVGYVNEQLPFPADTYYCGEHQNDQQFREKGYKIHLFNRKEIDISATQIRAKMNANDPSWKDLVPTQIYHLLTERRQNMIKNKFSPLYCDLYHLTMAQAMFDQKTHDKIETYEMFIRHTPFEGSYLLAAGLGEVLEWLNDWHYSKEDIDYLRTLGFKEDFLNLLANARLEINMDAFREGEIVFPNEPIVRVTGPAWQAVMVEAAILNIINAQSLFATKASRIVQVARSDGKHRTLLDMGLRRAQDTQGFTPTRAAYIAGFDMTSNVEAGRHYNIPVSGTMAHCFIMREETEKEAFKHYISAFPQQASVLIDTYDTIQGVKNAIAASKETGIPLKSVRLDSGDLAYLSKEVRRILDENGCKETKITASNDLDEYTIQSLLLEQNAPIDIFGVGTKLVTAYDQPALGGVYKLKRTGNRDVIKVSELAIKTTIPGATDVVRLVDEKGQYAGDVICSEGHTFVNHESLAKDLVSIDLKTEKGRRFLKGKKAFRPMIPVIRNGHVNQDEMKRPLSDIRTAAQQNIARLDPTHRRIKMPHRYIAGLEQSLYEKQCKLRREALQRERSC